MDHIAEIRPLLAEKYAPISRINGGGNQKAYLAEVSAELFSLIQRLTQGAIPESDTIDPSAVSEKWREKDETAIEDLLLADRTLDATIKKSLVEARRGQGRFRHNVLTKEFKCRVCGLADLRLLTASHIKPWARCETAAERLDGHNGLMLAPHVDRLFDLGLISFRDNGQTIVSEALIDNTLSALGLGGLRHRNVGTFTSEQSKYLAYHRENEFKP